MGLGSFIRKGLRGAVVSIPRSGFCGVGLGDKEVVETTWVVSIPRSGFCGVGRGVDRSTGGRL